MISQDVIIVDLIYLMIAILLSSLAIIFYVRFSFLIEKRWISDVRNLLDNLLASYLNEHDQLIAEKTKSRIKRIAKDKKKKQILLEELISICQNFSGSYSLKALELHKELQLHRLSIAKVRSRKWNRKIEGLVELSFMRHEDSSADITKLLQDKSIHVRRQAKIALVELEHIKGLKKLADYPTAMSQWTFLSILAIMHRYPIKITKSDLETLESSPVKNIQALAFHLDQYSIIS